MKTRGFMPLIIWIIIGGVICAASKSLKLGSFRHPGAGMFPFIIGSVIILLSSIQVVIQLVQVKAEIRILKFWPLSAGFKRVIAVFILLILYAASLDSLGFLLCTFAFFVLLFKTVGQKAWIYILFNSLMVSALSYLFFEVLLKINLPKGYFGI